MSTGLVIMTINQLISETKKTKGLKDRKKQRYLRDLEKLKLEYEKIEVPEYFSKQYNQLNGKGKELIKDMRRDKCIKKLSFSVLLNSSIIFSINTSILWLHVAIIIFSTNYIRC